MGVEQEARPAHGGGTRRVVLAGAAAAAGAIVAGGVSVPALGRGSAVGDVEILRFALRLEELQAALYAQALQHSGLTGELRQYAEVVGAQERAHVAFLRKALGAHAQAAPEFDFGDAVADPHSFAVTARQLEDLGLAALDGQGPNLTRPTLAAAARIVSVEARHAAWIRDLLGELPAPAPSNPTASAADAAAAIRKTGFVRSAG